MKEVGEYECICNGPPRQVVPAEDYERINASYHQLSKESTNAASDLRVRLAEAVKVIEHALEVHGDCENCEPAFAFLAKEKEKG
jgi:hypothetical protein